MYVDNETICRIISEVKLGKSLGEIERLHGFTRSDIQKALRNYVGSNREYREIMKHVSNDCSQDDEIVVSETGVFMMKDDVLRECSAIYVPRFCLGEIEKLYGEKPSVIASIKADKRLVWMEEPYYKVILPDKYKPFKRRTIGIVRLAADIATYAKSVKVVTTSIEVQNLVVCQRNEKISVFKY